MTSAAGVHPVFAVAEAACLVLAVGGLAERAGRTRHLAPFLVAAGIALAVAPGAPGPRLLATLLLFATAGVVPACLRRMEHLSRGAGGRPAVAPALAIGAALALTVVAVIFAATSRPAGEPVAIALATVLVGLLAVVLAGAEARLLLLLGLPGAGVALLAASLAGAPPVLIVLPVLLPLLALLAGAAILARVATLQGGS